MGERENHRIGPVFGFSCGGEVKEIAQVHMHIGPLGNGERETEIKPSAGLIGALKR
jgi:hypothetical protein